MLTKGCSLRGFGQLAIPVVVYVDACTIATIEILSSDKTCTRRVVKIGVSSRVYDIGCSNPRDR